MDINALFCFQAVYEERSLHKAAKKLYISQQGLSRIVTSLEKELGCKLFERDYSGMHPTPESDRLFQTARSIQREMKLLRRDLEVSASARQTVKVVCAYGTMHLLYPALQRFERQYPDIEVKWAECIDEECDRCLLEQECDMDSFLTMTRPIGQVTTTPGLWPTMFSATPPAVPNGTAPALKAHRT